MTISLESVYEPQPAEKWRAQFQRVWPVYHKWFLSEGYTRRPGYLTSATKLREFMPELLPVYERLCELSGGHDVESRFLSLWCPPPYLAGCSQIAWNRDGSYLLRNYDYGNDYFDGVLLYSHWLQPVIGMVDCTWGLLDGMNAAGLAASLTFGGRKVRGEGFGIPLVLRYVLETCSCFDEALEAFRRIPVHMSYNVTLIEAAGKAATLFLNPDRAPEVIHDRITTNHQGQVEWTEYAELSATVMRKEFLDICAAQPDENVQTLLRRFLNAPLYSTRFDKAFGTLYTVVYDVGHRAVGVHWPTQSLTQSFENFTEETRSVHLIPDNIPGS